MIIKKQNKLSRMPNKYLIYPLLCCVIGLNCLCSKKSSNNPNPGPGPGPTGPDVEFWLTTANGGGSLLEKQSGVLSFGTAANNNLDINIDTTATMQTVDGFGYTLTGGSAYLINHMNTTEKNALLNEL